MKRVSFILLFSVFIVSLQQAVFSRISILNVSIDLAFIYIICFALVRDDIESLYVALFTGIVRDSFFPGIFGVNTVLYLVTSFVVCQVQKRIYRDSVLIPMLMTFLFTALKSLLYFMYFYIAGVKFDFREHVVSVMVFESIYNSVASIFVYSMIKRINGTSVMHKDWRF